VAAIGQNVDSGGVFRGRERFGDKKSARHRALNASDGVVDEVRTDVNACRVGYEGRMLLRILGAFEA